MNTLTIRAPSGKLSGKITLPYSKSISNRALILQALSGNKIQISHLSSASDTLELTAALKHTEENVLTGEGGTTYRFLTAYFAQLKGKWALAGSGRMNERPIGGLVDGLVQAGAEITYLGEIGYPPVKIIGRKLEGGTVKLDSAESSQFVSAMLMVAPFMQKGLEIIFNYKQVSAPYINMTIRMLREQGINILEEENRIIIKNGKFLNKPIDVEPDWSSVAFVYQLAAVAPEADILIPGLAKTGLQGDESAADIFRQFGVETIFEEAGARILKRGEGHIAKTFEAYLSGTPDLVISIAVTCAILGIRATLFGVGHLRYKESDRIASLKIELIKIGARTEFDGERLTIIPGKISTGSLLIDPHNDHRIAMAFSAIALMYREIKIIDYQVVEKSFPNFWEELKNLGFQIID